MRMQRVALLLALWTASCDPTDGLHWSVQGSQAGIFSDLSNVTCMYAGPNAFFPERYIGIDLSIEDHPDVQFISMNIRPMPDEVMGSRTLRNSPYLGTYDHHELYYEDVEMRTEVSLGEESYSGGVTRREVMIHNLVIPAQTMGTPDPGRTFKLEGRITDLRMWCTTDKI